MLILAGVTISIVINGGLFRQAQSAVISADISSAEETIQPEIVAKQIDKRNNTDGISRQDIIEAVNGTGVLKEINETNITENEEGDAWILSGETLKGNVIHNIKIQKHIAGVEVLSTTTTPPLASENIEFTYSPSGWTNGNVDVGVGAEGDPRFKDLAIQYSRDGNTWEDYGGEITYEENGTIYARLKDMSSGSVGEAATGNISNIDKTAPTIGTVTAKTNSVTFAGTDIGSGINGYQVTTSTAEPTSGWTSITPATTLGNTTVSGLTQNTTYYIWVKDQVGNVNEAKAAVTGTVAGLTTGNVTFTYTPSTWTNGSVVVKISTTVTGYTLQYSTNGTTWVAYPAAGVTYTANGTIYARLTDGTNVGGQATGNVTNIDKLAPGVSAVAVSAGTLGTNSWYTTNITVKVTAGTDTGGSGVQKVTYTLSGATTKAETTITSGSTFSITADGSTTVTCYTYDNAGNKSGAATLTVKKDATVPTVNTPTITNNTTSGFTVNFAGADKGGSGLASYTIEYKKTADSTYTSTTVSSTAASGTKALTGLADMTTYNVRIKSTDAAGNVSAYSSVVNTGVGYVQSGLMVWFDGSNNAGTSTTSSHSATAATWKDLTGNGYNGTPSGGPTWGSNYLSLDGVNDYVQTHASLGAKATMEVVVKPGAISSPNYYRFLCNMQSGGRSINCVAMKPTGDVWIDGAMVTVGNAGTMTAGTIYSLSTGNDGTNLYIRYKDTITTKAASGTYTTPTSGTVYTIGADPTPTGIGMGANGVYGKFDIYSVRMYSRCLTNAEIMQNYYVDKSRFGAQ